MQGTVSRVLEEKGFGFIKGEDGVERFFHRSECLQDFHVFQPGRAVEFAESRNTAKGPRAEAVQLA